MQASKSAWLKSQTLVKQLREANRALLRQVDSVISRLERQALAKQALLAKVSTLRLKCMRLSAEKRQIEDETVQIIAR